jgi:hypothetical protein
MGNLLSLLFDLSYRNCNSSCAGNSMMKCGGSNRILVFGPPPGTPVVVHSGVQQTCQSWCQTSTGPSVGRFLTVLYSLFDSCIALLALSSFIDMYIHKIHYFPSYQYDNNHMIIFYHIV